MSVLETDTSCNSTRWPARTRYRVWGTGEDTSTYLVHATTVLLSHMSSSRLLLTRVGSTFCPYWLSTCNTCIPNSALENVGSMPSLTPFWPFPPPGSALFKDCRLDSPRRAPVQSSPVTRRVPQARADSSGRQATRARAR